MAKATCSIDGCEKPARARGWCPTHYSRWRVNGDPLVVLIIVGDDTARFLSYFDRTDADECWPWLGGLRPEGYGAFFLTDRHVSAHRYSYEHFIGPVPEGLVLDHTCHKGSVCVGGVGCPHRRCVNPGHLEPVTNEENIRRGNIGMVRKARRFCRHGHRYTPTNTYIAPDGARQCRECRRLGQAARRAAGK